MFQHRGIACKNSILIEVVESFFKYFFGVPHLATCIFFLFKYCIE